MEAELMDHVPPVIPLLSVHTDVVELVSFRSPVARTHHFAF